MPATLRAPEATRDPDVPAAFLRRLRHATHAAHAALERKLPLLDPTLSRHSYGQLVGRFFGYHAPLEFRLLGATAWHDIGLAYTERCKTGRLAQDLKALGFTAEAMAALPQCRDLPEVDSSAALIGCLYVVEGATLGGQVIARHLQRLGLSPQSGASFFDGYGDQTWPRWRAFGSVLVAFEQRTGDGDEIIDSANRTFASIDRWLSPQAAGSAPLQ